MPDMWMDINTNVVVPMNVLPLTLKSDFITPVGSVVYNSPGIHVDWNFVTTAGVQTQTTIYPTAAGVHDIAYKGGGIYSIEMPATGGNANNNAYGFGWITGWTDTVLSWRGPTIGFRAATKNNELVDDATNIGQAALVDNNLDHLAKTATAADDMTTEMADSTILSRLFAAGDTSTFLPASHAINQLADEDEVAEKMLIYDWTAITGTVADRSTLNALRLLRNKWSISGTTLTVTEENDADPAWTAALTATSGADSITGVDPAGP